jgi:hypothetical protein
MKVLIVGSLNYPEGEQFETEFIAACRAIGEQLAKAGVEFVIGSGNPYTADRYVLEGAAEVPGTHKIWIFRPDDAGTPDLPWPGPKTTFVKFFKRLRGPWAAGRFPQMQAADAVFLIGGGRGTLQVGYAAVALGKPAVAVGSCKGAAEVLWEQLEPFYQRAGRLRDEIGNLREQWQPEYAELVVRAITVLARRGAFRRNNPRAALLVLLLNICLFAAWVWLFVDPPLMLRAAIFALLAVAAFLGTSLRVALRAVIDPAEQKTIDVVLAELSAGLVLAFGLAMLYLAGSFTFTGKFQPFSMGSTGNSPDDDYRRVAVGMTVIGIAGGWLLERVAERLTRSIGARLDRVDDGD